MVTLFSLILLIEALIAVISPHNCLQAGVLPKWLIFKQFYLSEISWQRGSRFVLRAVAWFYEVAVNPLIPVTSGFNLLVISLTSSICSTTMIWLMTQVTFQSATALVASSILDVIQGMLVAVFFILVLQINLRSPSRLLSRSVRIDPTQFVSTVRTACTAQSHSSQQCKRRPFLANIRDGDKWYLWFYITDHVPLNIINYTIIDILLFLSSYTDCRRVGSSRFHHHVD